MLTKKDLDQSSQLMKLYKIEGDVKSEKLIVLKELNHNQIIFQANEIPHSVIVNTFETNRYLHLPRIASKAILFDLCPVLSNVMHQK